MYVLNKGNLQFWPDIFQVSAKPSSGDWHTPTVNLYNKEETTPKGNFLLYRYSIYLKLIRIIS
jgi:hypothetical protein